MSEKVPPTPSQELPFPKYKVPFAAYIINGLFTPPPFWLPIIKY
jgi:hypothetical protein